MTKYKLAQLAEIKYGKDHKKLGKGSVPVYGTGGIMRYVNDFIYEGESVLIPRKGSLNNLFYVHGKFWTVDTIFWTKIDSKIVLPRYLYYYLSRIDLTSYNVGSAVPSLTISLLNELVLDIPPISVQKDVVNKLTAIENKIKINEQINDNLLELINSIYSARQSSDAKKEEIHISDLFDTSSTTYRINEHSNEFVWHFSIPNFDQQRYPTIDSVKDIKSNKIIVKPFSVLVSKLNPTTRRIWAPSTDSFNKYSKVCSTEFVSISGNDITEQATIFAITRSDDFMKYLSSKATGSTNSRQRVKPIDIYSYTLPISKSTLSQIQKQLALLLQKLQSNQDEIITLIKLKQELLFKYF
ncbi:restriction endonuclease subunit S [Lactobacillus delbrueckii]|uniref:restriction endonuclease subunit S n=1 Tax=Lactobacillus delbrueckii TaxID=1584 RepID=UPI001E566687|nr:restriction endonuclease subunit S [Lactobacillus delbrueckii]MCD5504025.1 restriction endonuclease subunit S [Lactobacillus delbrueckii subsp. lactis]